MLIIWRRSKTLSDVLIPRAFHIQRTTNGGTKPFSQCNANGCALAFVARLVTAILWSVGNPDASIIRQTDKARDNITGQVFETASRSVPLGYQSIREAWLRCCFT